jgi:hypothetical protein
MERALARAARLIGLFRANAMPVIHVRHLEHDPAVGFLLEGTPGADIDPRVAPQGDDVLVTKHYPNAFAIPTLPKCCMCRVRRSCFSAVRPAIAALTLQCGRHSTWVTAAR